MTQNFVKVSQEHKHIVVKNAGGLRGLPGPQGIQGIPGPAGERGPVGVQGERGPAGEAGPAGPAGERGPAGEKGETGATGPQGPAGPAGAGLVISGSVDTYAELPSGLGPSDAGKAYFVQADGKLYVWTGTAWPADGEGAQFEGPQGPTGATGATGQTGPAGADGYSPTATVSKSGDTATITITDKNGTTTAQVSDGAAGADGFSPIATVSKVGTTTTISITDEQGTTTATVNDGITPTIDSALSTVSENPVQNKIVTGALNNKQATLQASDITNTLIQNGAVTGAANADTSVNDSNSKIALNTVGTPNLRNGSVTLAKIESTTLFTSQAGQGLGSFLLSDAIENYKKLEIEYADNSGNRGLKSFRVVPGGTNQTTLTTFQPGFGSDNTFYIQSAIVSFAGTNGNIAVCRGGAVFSGNYPTVDATPNNNVMIYSVVGYN